MTTHDDTANIMRELERELGVRGPANVLRAALKIAKEAAAQAGRPDPKPVDPAWMVEVAREACAERCEKFGTWPAANSYRTGLSDELDGVQDGLAALRLALSRGHVVLAPVMPSEEEMLWDAREDAAQINDTHYPDWAEQQRAGAMDTNDEVRAALQARRNVYASLGALAGEAVSSGPVVPEVDLRGALGKAYSAGHARACFKLRDLTAQAWERGLDFDRDSSVSEILKSLKSGEA